MITDPPKNLEISIPWDAPRSYEVTTVVAMDLDSGRNAKLSYEIFDVNNLFGIDSDSGFVFVKSDSRMQETRDRRYTVELRVADNGEQTNVFRQSNSIYFDGNYTLFNHSAFDPSPLPHFSKLMVRSLLSLFS